MSSRGENAAACRSTDQLARDARAGSAEAFADLAGRLMPPVERFLRTRTLSAHDAEDLAQETFLRARQMLHQYDPQRPFMPWLMTIAANLAAGLARSRRAAVDIAAMDVASKAPTPAQQAARAEEAAAIWRAARHHLPARQYDALHLRYAEELDVARVAERMNLSRIHVKVLLHRARKRLLKLPAAQGSQGTEEP